MKNDYNYIKNNKIKEISYNDDFKNIYNTKEKIVNKKDYIIKKYKTTPNFSQLFSNRRQSSQNTTGYVPNSQSGQTQTPTIQISQSQVTSSQPSSSPADNQTQLQGKTYDASNMWSPQSYTGRIYEWDRGVIAISYDGFVEKESLDGTSNHHSDATVRVAQKLGVTIQDNGMPFEIALKATERGLVVLQSEGDNCFLYLPEYITLEQQQKISESVIPRKGFNFSFIHDEEIFEDKDFQMVINYVNNLALKLQQTSTRAR